jgi:hypothetical protein
MVAAMQACGGSSSGLGDTAPTSEAGALDGDLAETGDPADAASDAETITDGGANIDPDAGVVDVPDAAPCNTLANTAPPITSKCVSTVNVLGGGALVAGTYFLVGVDALAPPNFCQKSFVPTGFKETLELTVSATGVGTAETHSNVAGGASRRATSTLTPTGTNKSPLQATPTCPTAAAAAVPYQSMVIAGRQQLVVRLPYGKAEALYRFEKQ